MGRNSDTCSLLEPDCVHPTKAEIKSTVLFNFYPTPPLSILVLVARLYLDPLEAYLGGQTHRKHTRTHKSTQNAMKDISVEVWWNQHCWFVICLVHREWLPNSHWYGCHGKRTGLVHARQKSDVLPVWLQFIFAPDSFTACKERITPVIWQLIRHFSALQTCSVR